MANKGTFNGIKVCIANFKYFSIKRVSLKIFLLPIFKAQPPISLYIKVFMFINILGISFSKYSCTLSFRC